MSVQDRMAVSIKLEKKLTQSYHGASVRNYVIEKYSILELS